MSATDQTTFLVKYGRQTITINIDPEFKSLIAPLSDLEFNQLKENIRTDVDGVREPLAVWAFGSCDEEGQPTYLLLDGHHRYRAWKELSDEGEVLHALRIFTPIIGDTRDAALLWIEENQIGRRNLTDDQRAVIWESIRERRSAIASKEGAAKARAAKVDSAKTTETEAPSTPAKRDTREEVAIESGLPESKLRAVAKLKKVRRALVQDVRAGQITLRQATKQAKTAIAPKPQPSPAPQPIVDAEFADVLPHAEAPVKNYVLTFYAIRHKATGYFVQQGPCLFTGDESWSVVDSLRLAHTLVDDPEGASLQMQLGWAIKELGQRTANRKHHYKPEDFELVEVRAGYTVKPVGTAKEHTDDRRQRQIRAMPPQSSIEIVSKE